MTRIAGGPAGPLGQAFNTGLAALGFCAAQAGGGGHTNVSDLKK